MSSASSRKRQKTALVFECNAIQEELQQISMQWLKPDITVITNVREDHVGELGTAEQAARIFAAALPENSILVTSESRYMGIWEAAAKEKKIRLCYVDPAEAGDCAFPENAACILGTADCLDIGRAEAARSITGFKPDTGAFVVHSWNYNSRNGDSRPVFFADARAANDIESTNCLSAIARHIIKPAKGIRRILLLVNREDRPDRSEIFMRYIIDQHRELNFDEYLCLGHVPMSFRSAMKREGINCRTLRNINDLEQILTEASGQAAYIFAVGNHGGKGKLVSDWLARKRKEGGLYQIPETPVLKEAPASDGS